MIGLRKQWIRVSLCFALAVLGRSDDAATTKDAATTDDAATVTDGPSGDGPLSDAGPDSAGGESLTLIVVERTEAAPP